MTLDKQVCSLELAKKLKELGVKQNALYFYGFVPEKINQYQHRKEKWHLLYDWGKKFQNWQFDKCSAFTVAELGELLKPHTKSFQSFDEHCCGHEICNCGLSREDYLFEKENKK